MRPFKKKDNVASGPGKLGFFKRKSKHKQENDEKKQEEQMPYRLDGGMNLFEDSLLK